MEKFKTIQEACEAQLLEKKSKFIANFYPIQTKEEAETILKEIRRKHFNAKHHCFAYTLMDGEKVVERCSDDGEPSGTAGGPMLNIVKKNKLYNVLVVITRYFGGILLGTGGLVRAYSEATIRVMQQAKYLEKELGQEIKITMNYAEIQLFKYYCNKYQIKVLKEEYLNNVVFWVEITDKMLRKLNSNIDKLNFNMIKMEQIRKKYIDVNVNI